jgi:hypothetical protein
VELPASPSLDRCFLSEKHLAFLTSLHFSTWSYLAGDTYRRAAPTSRDLHGRFAEVVEFGESLANYVDATTVTMQSVPVDGIVLYGSVSVVNTFLL